MAVAIVRAVEKSIILIMYRKEPPRDEREVIVGASEVQLNDWNT
jgi:hypothetical protein